MARSPSLTIVIDYVVGDTHPTIIIYRICVFISQISDRGFRICVLSFKICVLSFKIRVLVFKFCVLVFKIRVLVFNICVLVYRICVLSFKIRVLVFKFCDRVFKICRLITGSADSFSSSAIAIVRLTYSSRVPNAGINSGQVGRLDAAMVMLYNCPMGVLIRQKIKSLSPRLNRQKCWITPCFPGVIQQKIDISSVN